MNLKRIVPIAFVVALSMVPVIYAEELPEGEGKELVLSACTVCHGLGNITKSKLTTEEWRNVAYDMDAPLSDEEVDKVAEYLGKFFGPDSPPANESGSEEKEASRAIQQSIRFNLSARLKSAAARIYYSAAQSH